MPEQKLAPRLAVDSDDLTGHLAAAGLSPATVRLDAEDT
jgi:hypothetical protein